MVPPSREAGQAEQLQEHASLQNLCLSHSLGEGLLHDPWEDTC